MATFHSLSPPLGSHQTRNAPDLLSVELELLLPQDHFLPASNIQAEVWTNVIHKHNPEGPEKWAAIPMKLSNVLPGKNIAVFSASFRPTGRGDFGLTCRWKCHKDLKEWQWAPVHEAAATDKNTSNEGKDIVNKDVKVTVRVPRSTTYSSWTLGPQSLLIYGQHGPRVDVGSSVGGPGLYLGNHAAATRARISGYESVLSLVGDLLDFDEKIPESDKDVNKSAWMEQVQAQTPQKRFSMLSRSSSISSYRYDQNGADSSFLNNSNSTDSRLSRQSSISDFINYHTPGAVSDEVLEAIVKEPEDPPRLTRRSSVTDMMVQPPTATKASKRASRASASISSIASIDEDTAASMRKPEPTPANSNASTLEGATSSADQASTKTTQSSHSKKASASGANGPKTGAPTSAATSTATAPPPPVSKKGGSTNTQSQPASTNAAALPPVSNGKQGKTQPSGQAAAATTATTTTTTTSASPTVSSLAVSPALESARGDKGRSSDTAGAEREKPGTTNDKPTSSNDARGSRPPTSSNVVAGIQGHSFESQQALSAMSSMSNESAKSNEDASQPPKPRDFQHKVILLAPGAQTRISDAILKEAIEFLKTEVGKGKKVLVHCRDGNGRSGSVAIAYIAAQLKAADQANNQRTLRSEDGSYYDRAEKEVWKWKCDVYPHRGLRESVERIQL